MGYDISGCHPSECEYGCGCGTFKLNEGRREKSARCVHAYLKQMEAKTKRGYGHPRGRTSFYRKNAVMSNISLKEGELKEAIIRRSMENNRILVLYMSLNNL